MSDKICERFLDYGWKLSVISDESQKPTSFFEVCRERQIDDLDVFIAEPSVEALEQNGMFVNMGSTMIITSR